MFMQIPVNLLVTYQKAFGMFLAFETLSLILFSFSYFSYKFKHGGGFLRTLPEPKISWLQIWQKLHVEKDCKT